MNINCLAVFVVAVETIAASSVYCMVFGKAFAALLAAESVAVDVEKSPSIGKRR
jgi:hypothetical protein